MQRHQPRVGGAAHSGERSPAQGWGPHRLHPVLRLPHSGRDSSGGAQGWSYTPPPPGAGGGREVAQRQREGSVTAVITHLLHLGKQPPPTAAGAPQPPMRARPPGTVTLELTLGN